MKKSRFLPLASFALASAMFSSQAQSCPNGIAYQDCAGCHNGGTYSYTGSWSSLPTVLERNATDTVTFTLNGAGANSAGFAAQTSNTGANATFTATGGESQQGDGVSHSTPDTTEPFAWSFTLNAGNTSGSVVLQAWGNPVDGNRTTTAECLDFTGVTGDGAAVNASSTSIPINDRPTLTAGAGTTAYTEDGAAQTVAPSLTLTDTENSATEIQSATVSITNNQTGDRLNVNSLSCTANGLLCSGSGTSSITVSGGPESPGEFQNVFRAITYSTSSDTPSTTNRNVRFSVTDNYGRTRTSDRTVSVATNNDSPVITEGNGPLARGTSEDSTTYSFTLNATDAETANSSLSWSISSQASNGTATATGTGASKSISYVPNANYNGLDQFTVQVSDGTGGTDTVVVNMTVSSVEDDPIITQGAGPLARGTTEDSTTYSFGLNATDGDGDTITWTISSAAANGTAGVTNGTGNSETITYVPDPDYFGSDSFIVQASDGAGPVDTVQIDMTVSAVNDPPTITSTPGTSIIQTIEYSYTITVNDVDDTGLGSGYNLSLIQGPVGMSISAGGVLTWTPSAMIAPGTVETIIVQVEDGNEDMSDPALLQQQWDITVNDFNDPPAITTTAGTSATEDIQYTYVVGVSDPDDTNNGTDLQWSLTNEPTGMVISPTGTITWTPLEGVTTSGAVTVTVQDNGENGAMPDTEIFTVTVTAVNDAPAITTSAVTAATEDILYTYAVGVSDPDNVNDGSDLQWSLSNEPAGMVISATGTITWTPLEGVLTSGLVTVQVADSGADGAQPATQDFTVTVTPVNDPPVITSSAGTAATEDIQYSYQLTVSDPDDINNGSELLFDVLQGPAGMSVSATGLVTWTPVEAGPAQLTTYNEAVQLRVRDDGGSTPDTESFNITVTPINDSPVITPPVATQQVIEQTLYSYQVVVTDPDDNNNGSDLTWSLSGEPAGMTISNTGLIQWTPALNTDGDYTINVQVEDNGENSSVPGTDSYNLRVDYLDTDNDTIREELDNCPSVANTDQANNDGDADGDLCDDDDDNDGITDAAEIANGLDPFDDSDAELDLDGDGLTNLAEFQSCDVSDTNCLAIGIDSVAPVITVDDLVIDASGFVTDLNPVATVNDGVDGDLVAYMIELNGEVIEPLVSGSTLSLRPGTNEVLWSAQDAAANEGQATQVIDVQPLLTLAANDVVGEGQAYTLTVELNGEAPDGAYPVTVDYALSGTADSTDISAVTGSVDITSGESADINFTVVDDGLVEGDEDLTITVTAVSAGAVLSEDLSAQLLIIEREASPEVNAQELGQGGEQVSQIYADAGVVTITADAYDPNGGNLVYVWQVDPAIDATCFGDACSFDPSGLPDGSYEITLSVADPFDSTSVQLTFVVSSTAPVLDGLTDSDGDGIDDLSEGTGDSNGNGVPDYLDSIDQDNLLQFVANDGGLEANQWIAVTAGLKAALGTTALTNGNTGVQISSVQVVNTSGQARSAGPTSDPDPDFAVIGRLVDLAVSGLNETQIVAEVIIPQEQPMLGDLVFRVHDSDLGWFTFVEDANNQVSTAPMVDGVCPEASSSEWRSGVNAGDMCILALVSDGGPNDSDDDVNGVVRITAGAATARARTSAPTAPSEGQNSGGGSALWLLMLTMFIGLGFRLKRSKGSH